MNFTNCSDQFVLGETEDSPIEDPCLPVGFEEKLTVHFDIENLVNPEAKKVLNEDQVVHLSGLGDWDKCYNAMAKFIESREPYYESCQGKPGCPNSGMKMPPLPLNHVDFFGFSEFWYSSEDVVDMGGPYHYNKFSEVSRVSLHSVEI